MKHVGSYATAWVIPTWIIAGCGDGDLFSEASNASKQLVRNRHFCWFYSRHSVSGNVVNKCLYFIDTWMFIDYLLRHICIFFTMKSNLLKRGLKQRFLLLTESMAGCAESVSTNLCPGLQFVRRHATLENYPFVIFPISRILLGWITLDFTDIHVKFCTPSIRKPRAAELGFKSANFTVNFKLYIFQIQTKTADKWKICRT